MISVHILAAAVSLLLLALCRAEIKKLRLATRTWEELIRELKPVKTEGITLAALECSDASGWPPEIDPDELWTMIGGWDGLKQMQTNTEVLISLASHAKAWNLGGSTLMAERMRSEAIYLRRITMRLKIARTCRYGKKPAAVHIQKMACAYYGISELLLTLYETSPSRRYGQLKAAVWPYEKAGLSALSSTP